MRLLYECRQEKMKGKIYMQEENVPTSPTQSNQEEPKRRSPEIDVFVDHFLSTMCETSRRQILELLATPNRSTEGAILERRSTDIARELGLSFPTTSGHLRQLADAGLLSFRREGNAIYYRIKNDLLVKAFHDLIGALDNHYHSHTYLPRLGTSE
jgi:DNA-binding transcriptional ArsR family regulator